MSRKVCYRFESFQWSRHTDWITIKKSLSCYTKQINQIKSDCGFDEVAVSCEWRAFVICLKFWSWLVSLAPKWGVFGFSPLSKHFPGLIRPLPSKSLPLDCWCIILLPSTMKPDLLTSRKNFLQKNIQSLDPLLSLSS